MIVGAARAGRRGLARPWAVVVAVLCAAAAVWLLHLGRAHWFFADDWDFLLHGGVDERNLYLRPTNGHWMGATMVVFRVARSVTGLASHGVYLVPVVLSHVGLAAVLWLWQRRDGVRPPVATAVVACFLVYSAASENVFFAVNVGFNLSLLLGLGFALLVEDRGHPRSRSRLLAASIVALLAMPTSTTGPVLVAAIGLWRLVRRDLAGASIGAGPALAVYAAWRVLTGAATDVTASDLGDLGTFVGSLLVTAVGRLLGAEAVATAAVAVGVLVLAVLVWGRGVTGAWPRTATWVVTGTAIVTTVLTAVARAPYGVEIWRSPRYAYVVAALLLPLLGTAADRVARRPWLAVLLAVLVLPGALWSNTSALLRDQDDQAGLEQHLRNRWLAAAQLLEDGTTPVSPFVDRYWNPSLDVPHLRQLVAAEELPLPAEPVGDPWRLEALVELRTTQGQPPELPLQPPRLTDEATGACVHLEPGEAVTVAFPGPGGVRLQVPRRTIARLGITTETGRTTAYPRIVDVASLEESVWVALEQPVSVALSLDAGGQVCPV